MSEEDKFADKVGTLCEAKLRTYYHSDANKFSSGLWTGPLLYLGNGWFLVLQARERIQVLNAYWTVWEEFMRDLKETKRR